MSNPFSFPRKDVAGSLDSMFEDKEFGKSQLAGMKRHELGNMYAYGELQVNKESGIVEAA
jgi:hypothetical protein